MWPNTEHIHPSVSPERLRVTSLWKGCLLLSSTAPRKATAQGQLPLPDEADLAQPHLAYEAGQMKESSTI